jgi:hypothetical protein
MNTKGRFASTCQVVTLCFLGSCYHAKVVYKAGEYSQQCPLQAHGDEGPDWHDVMGDQLSCQKLYPHQIHSWRQALQICIEV